MHPTDARSSNLFQLTTFPGEPALPGGPGGPGGPSNPGAPLSDEEGEEGEAGEGKRKERKEGKEGKREGSEGEKRKKRERRKDGEREVVMLLQTEQQVSPHHSWLLLPPQGSPSCQRCPSVPSYQVGPAERQEGKELEKCYTAEMHPSD